MTKKILVCDDSSDIRFIMAELLKSEGYQVEEAVSVVDSIHFIENNVYDLVLLDLSFPDGEGFDVIKRARDLNIKVPIIVFTGYGSVENAIKAIKMGAYDFISKNEGSDYLLYKISQAIEMSVLKKSVKNGMNNNTNGYFGNSMVIRKLLDKIQRIVSVDVNVLITGESGTGKNLFAHYIHSVSHRKNMPFQTIDCGAIPDNLIEAELFGYEKGAFTGAVRGNKGKVELANGGTLFLDEIGNLSIDIQKKLLRLIDERKIQRIGSPKAIPVDVRIIASTNESLEEKVVNGTFREDLFFRLNVFPIKLPPLRERGQDILLLANYFLEKYAKKYKKEIKEFSYTVKKIFENYIWPGNVRELENVIQQAILMAEKGIITENDLPEYLIKKVGDISVIRDRSMVEENVLPENVGLKKLVEQYESNIISQL